MIMVVTRSFAKARHENVVGPIQQCEDCAVGKAHQKRVPKQPVARAKNPGERLFLDISHPKQQSIGGSNDWILVADDATDNCWSWFT